MSVADALEASAEETAREQEVEVSRLEMMRRYAEHTGCRRSFLLTYFGQDYRGSVRSLRQRPSRAPRQRAGSSHFRSAHA